LDESAGGGDAGFLAAACARVITDPETDLSVEDGHSTGLGSKRFKTFDERGPIMILVEQIGFPRAHEFASVVMFTKKLESGAGGLGVSEFDVATEEADGDIEVVWGEGAGFFEQFDGTFEVEAHGFFATEAEEDQFVVKFGETDELDAGPFAGLEFAFDSFDADFEAGHDFVEMRLGEQADLFVAILDGFLEDGDGAADVDMAEGEDGIATRLGIAAAEDFGDGFGAMDDLFEGLVHGEGFAGADDVVTFGIFDDFLVEHAAEGGDGDLAEEGDGDAEPGEQSDEGGAGFSVALGQPLPEGDAGGEERCAMEAGGSESLMGRPEAHAEEFLESERVEQEGGDEATNCQRPLPHN